MIDHLTPEAGLPLAALLWAVVALPHVARWNRARRAARKETCASLPTSV
ncbi:hypothetical protein PBI_FLOOF_54 [Microbacterium phage Floof]|uniref:Uncharacterized protein n=1 Tax=Microbacterium phage Floof TaxID=2201433 RepID=A0A2Z4Q4Q1_9CAUD|nr:hypothetical protein PBI_FLOOF_54 [Microbacterium phage Floof]